MAPVITVVLASASPSRLRILQQAGVNPIVCVSDVDEDAVAAALPAGSPSVRVVQELARAKAAEVLARHGARLAADARAAGAEWMAVIGCDSMLEVGGRLEGKPHTVERARERWHALRGKHGVLLTGHALVVVDLAETRDDRSGADGTDGAAGPAVLHRSAGTSDTTVHFGDPSEADLDAYLRTGEPLECAGAFTLESLGGWFIDRIDGDPSSVIGLSLPLLRRLLREAGIEVRQLWRPDLLG